ncbi:hypothetical protein R3P38DRAFT_2781372 [Favolaschia claudopus]|uniref:Secreted protein n=1 Tax=Favolaschia claudopus TaxID=2862362 RepID=A0AAW0B605_9AGAR
MSFALCTFSHCYLLILLLIQVGYSSGLVGLLALHDDLFVGRGSSKFKDTSKGLWHGCGFRDASDIMRASCVFEDRFLISRMVEPGVDLGCGLDRRIILGRLAATVLNSTHEHRTSELVVRGNCCWFRRQRYPWSNFETQLNLDWGFAQCGYRLPPGRSRRRCSNSDLATPPIVFVVQPVMRKPAGHSFQYALSLWISSSRIPAYRLLPPVINRVPARWGCRRILECACEERDENEKHVVALGRLDVVPSPFHAVVFE